MTVLLGLLSANIGKILIGIAALLGLLRYKYLVSTDKMLEQREKEDDIVTAIKRASSSIDSKTQAEITNIDKDTNAKEIQKDWDKIA